MKSHYLFVSAVK